MNRCGECKLGRNEPLVFYCEENLEYEECISRLQYALNTLSADKSMKGADDAESNEEYK